MNRCFLLVAVVALVAAPSVGRAQGVIGQPPSGRQPVSPYLNLLRGGNPAINYYGVVRPLEQLEQQQLQQQGVYVGQTTGLDPNRPVYSSGYNTRFQSYNQYFGTIRPVPVPRVGTGSSQAGINPRAGR